MKYLQINYLCIYVIQSDSDEHLPWRETQHRCRRFGTLGRDSCAAGEFGR
jgi:hypothetical protein